jgi:dTDP-4-amino-4,6-dideoxygalactose transaminase
MFLWYERTTLTNCEQADKKVVFLPIHTSVTKDSLRALADFLDHLEPTW